MTTSRIATRRDLVRALAVAALAPSTLLSCGRQPIAPSLAALLVSRMRRPEAMRAIGRAVVVEHPDVGDPDALAARIAGDLGWVPEMAGEELDRRLGERIRDDLRSGRLLLVDSWRLAETEAHVAALIALAPE